MLLPQKLLSRKEEITADFFKLVDQHMADLLDNRADRLYHAKDFAALLFIHPRHLTNTLKLTTGRSPCYFMEERVAAEAKKMLQDKDRAIADISSTFTYSEPTNFTKFFKSMTGMTPMQYRRSCHVAAEI